MTAPRTIPDHHEKAMQAAVDKAYEIAAGGGPLLDPAPLGHVLRAALKAADDHLAQTARNSPPGDIRPDARGECDVEGPHEAHKWLAPVDARQVQACPGVEPAPRGEVSHLGTLELTPEQGVMARNVLDRWGR